MGLRLMDLVGTSDNKAITQAVDRITLVSDTALVPWADISDDGEYDGYDDDDLYDDCEECEGDDDDAALVGCTDYVDPSECPGCVGCMEG